MILQCSYSSAISSGESCVLTSSSEKRVVRLNWGAFDHASCAPQFNEHALN